MNMSSMLFSRLILVALCLLFSQGSWAINSTKIDEYTDASGKITVAVFERIATSAQASFDDFAVEVSADYLAVGGGVEGAQYPYGHYLTASYPCFGCTPRYSKWFVSTKDHVYSNPTQIKAYAIGLKIQGLSSSELSGYLTTPEAGSSYTNHPAGAAGVPSGYLLISGGFRPMKLQVGYNWQYVGNLATASFPSANTWTARVKDHQAASNDYLRIYAIGLKENIPSVGTIAVIQKYSGSNYGEHIASSTYLDAGYALVGCGAYVNYAISPGNLLWKIKPVTLGIQRGCEAAAKDLTYVSYAFMSAFALGIKAN